DPLRAGAGVPGDLLAGELDHVRYAVRTVERPRIPVQDHEVDLVGGGGEDDLVPASLVALGHDRVRPLGGGGEHGADLDAGVDRLHRVGVGDEVAGVLGRALVVVVVGLPGGAVVAVAVVLVADLPVLDAVALGDVGVPDPGGGLLGRAGAVVGGHHRLGAGAADPGHEGVEVGVRGDVAAGGGVVGPVVDVGVRAAGVAEQPHARRLEQVGGVVRAQVGVPDGMVGADARLGHVREGGAGVDGHLDRGGVLGVGGGNVEGGQRQHDRGRGP